MPTTISKIQIVNMALSRLGVKPISDFDAQDDIPAEQARINWDLAFGEVARAHNWSCLMAAAVLEQVAQDPITPADPVPASTAWAPSTAYLAGAYVTYGSPAYLYQALINNTSTASFVNDLTSGFWFQTDILDTDPFSECPGENYASGWGYKYNLPEDCLLLVKLNDNFCDGFEEEFEILGASLYTDETEAVIKYVQAQPDTTRYDTLFVGCLVLKLAGAIATMLRQDDTNISVTMNQLYADALRKARVKDAGERKPRRFDPVANSRFVNSRLFSTNS